MTKKDKKNNFDKLIIINWLSVISIFFLIFAVSLFISIIVYWVKFLRTQQITPGNYEDPSKYLGLLLSVGLAFFIFASLIWLINIANAIIILSTDWKSCYINEIKTLWGLFTLFILGPFASLHFSISSIKVMDEQDSEYNITA